VTSPASVRMVAIVPLLPCYAEGKHVQWRPRKCSRGETSMPRLAGKIAWITGAGSGIGEAAALALAEEGATTVLTGRRREPLEGVAARIHQKGGTAHVQPADLTNSKQVQAIGAFIKDTFGRLDILVNNAGLNILDRHWDKLTPEGIDTMVHGNLSQALYCVTVALPFMRAQQDGVLIHTASMAGRFIGGFSGPIYGAAKHGIVAMSHTINMAECVNGIRSTVFLPGEVATPILDKRPNPVGPEERARMVQSEDCGDLIRYVACLPKHVVMSEVMLAPTHNRTYVANLQRKL
jgi:NADP-dependent 3-hydroxy acid dehydrogenase YdfG